MNTPTPIPTELEQKLLTYLQKKKNPTIDTVSNDLSLSRYEVIGLVTMLKQPPYYKLIDIIDDRIVRTKPLPQNDVYHAPLPPASPSSQSSQSSHIRLLLISDTHLASKYDRLDILRYLYEKALDTDTHYVLHSGDFTDGRSNRPEHVYELRALSYEGQVEYCVENYPRPSPSDNINTYVISGNHDDWWYKSTGSEIIRSIAREREDIHYLGADCADLCIGTLKIRLFHGAGSTSYARSYRIQKYLDSIPQNERPHILQTGHIHQSFYMKQDNTHCFQTSCLEDQTPYTRSLGLANDKSVWWVDVTLDDKGNPHLITQELETFGPRLVRKRHR